MKFSIPASGTKISSQIILYKPQNTCMRVYFVYLPLRVDSDAGSPFVKSLVLELIPEILLPAVYDIYIPSYKKKKQAGFLSITLIDTWPPNKHLLEI